MDPTVWIAIAASCNQYFEEAEWHRSWLNRKLPAARTTFCEAAPGWHLFSSVVSQSGAVPAAFAANLKRSLSGMKSSGSFKVGCLRVGGETVSNDRILRYSCGSWKKKANNWIYLLFVTFFNLPKFELSAIQQNWSQTLQNELVVDLAIVSNRIQLYRHHKIYIDKTIHTNAFSISPRNAHRSINRRPSSSSLWHYTKNNCHQSMKRARDMTTWGDFFVNRQSNQHSGIGIGHRREIGF